MILENDDPDEESTPLSNHESENSVIIAPAVIAASSPPEVRYKIKRMCITGLK